MLITKIVTIIVSLQCFLLSVHFTWFCFT